MHRSSLLACVMVAGACASAPPAEPVRVRPPVTVIVPTPPPPRPVRIDEAWIDHTLRSLSLREKVGQLVIPRISGDYLAIGSPQYHRLKQWVETYGVGGVIITKIGRAHV